MKTKAALILIHEINSTLEELIKNLLIHEYNVYIHADKKMVNFDTKLWERYRQIKVFNEYPIFWGGFNMIQAMLFLLNRAWEVQENQNFIFLSGGDIVNPKIKDHILKLHKRRVRQAIKNNIINRSIFHRRRFGKYSVDSIDQNFRIKNNLYEQYACRLRHNFYALLHPNICCEYELLLKGSQWITLDREDADVCLRVFNDPEKRMFWSNFPCPDEWFFYTILNGELPDKYDFHYLPDQSHYLGYEHHLIDWTKNHMSPAQVSLERFAESPFYFGRKIINGQ